MQPRIVTFDEATAERLAALAPELRDGDPVTEALANDRPSVLILPATASENTLLARVVPRAASLDPRIAPAKRYAAGGFLGLSDEPIYDDKKPRG